MQFICGWCRESSVCVCVCVSRVNIWYSWQNKKDKQYMQRIYVEEEEVFHLVGFCFLWIWNMRKESLFNRNYSRMSVRMFDTENRKRNLCDMHTNHMIWTQTHRPRIESINYTIICFDKGRRKKHNKISIEDIRRCERITWIPVDVICKWDAC